MKETYQMNNSNFNISMKDHFALLAGVRTKAFGHRNHVESKHVNVLLRSLVIARVIGAHVIDDFGGLSKARFVATCQFALESHVTMTGFQVGFGVRHISVAKVTAKFAFDCIVMPLGFEMILSSITTIVPEIGEKNSNNSEFFGKSQKIDVTF